MSQAMIDAGGRGDATQAVDADIRRLTAAQLRMLGLARIAYLTGSQAGDGTNEYVIHGADGGAVAIVEDLDVALDLVDRLGVSLVAVH
jgi:hypothetical protein